MVASGFIEANVTLKCMTYFYHGIPEDMKGDSLIPLSEMMSVDPELRAKYLEKYKGR